MLRMALTNNESDMEISYGIYTIERLPKGSRRTPKWDLHSTAKDKDTAEVHAKTLAAQPYFDHIEVQEFRICPTTKERTVHKIKSYSRKTSHLWSIIGAVALISLVILALS